MENCVGCHVTCDAIGALKLDLVFPSAQSCRKITLLLEVRDSMAEFGILQGKQSLNLSPQTPKCGKKEALHPPPAQPQLMFLNFPSFTMQLIFMESSQDGDGWI